MHVVHRLKGVSIVAVMAASVLLTGCQKSATGQVVAVVNGEEITLQELNAELGAMKIPENADKKTVRQSVLQQIVNRRLIAQQAKKDGVDRDPAYVSQQRRMDEQLLVSMYGRKTLESIGVPDDAALKKVMSENPTLFGGRTIYKVDQIQFEVPQDPKRLAPIMNIHTMDGVASYLTSAGIKFGRGMAEIDSGRVPPDMMKKVLSLKPGEPFIVPSNDPSCGCS